MRGEPISLPINARRVPDRGSAFQQWRELATVSTGRTPKSPSAVNLQLHGQMIKTTTFAAPGAVDKVLERLRLSHGGEQHDGLAGRTSRDGGIGTIPDDPDGTRPFPPSARDIVIGFGLWASQATLPRAALGIPILAPDAPHGKAPRRRVSLAWARIFGAIVQ